MRRRDLFELGADELNRRMHARNHVPALRKKVEERDQCVCQVCGWDDKIYPRAWQRWQIHHVIAIIEGGTTTMDNLITLCQKCHGKQTQELLARRRQG